MKKFVVSLLGMLLLALPLLGVPAQEASAASSRVAVIKEIKGSVTVKKSGGSKEFTAFAKMSLNEGDILTVGKGGSAVLQFANGTSEDDKMAVSANTTLTFSKLKEGKNTVTKVSVRNGSVWSTVKSIKNAGDQFTLETPTAVMGVRGTNLFVAVDPVTGDARFIIASGVGQVSPTNSRKGKTTPPVPVYPGQQVTIDDRDETNEFPDEVIPVDLSALANNLSADVLAAILQAKNEIDRENEEFIRKKREELQSGQNDPAIELDTQADLDRLIQNLNYLVGNVLQEALRNNTISQEQLQGLIDEANKTLTNKIDLANTPPPTLTEIEKRKAEQIKKQEEARLEAAKKQKEAEQQSRLAELVKKVEEEKKKREEANQKALEDAKKKAKEEYEKKLSEAEKQRFAEASKSREDELKNRATPSPSAIPSPSAGGGGGSSGGGNNGGGTNPTPVAPFGLYLKSAASPEVQQNFTYSASQTHYSFNVQDHVQEIAIKRNPSSSNEIIFVKYSFQSECGLGEGTDYCYEYAQGGIGGYVVPLAPGSNSIVIETMTPGGSSGITREFTLDIHRSKTPAGILGWNVEIPMEEYGLEWQVTGIDRYALDLNEYFDSYSIPELEMGLELAPGITRAELTYEGSPIQGQPQLLTATWTESGVQTVAGLTEGYLRMTLDLYAGTTKKYAKELWIINGFAEMNDTEPVKLTDNQNRDVFYEPSHESYYQLAAYLQEEATALTISEISDAAESSMRLQSVMYGGSEYFASNGSVQLNLNSNIDNVVVHATDPSGLYLYEYVLEVVRVPAGITSWQLYYGGSSANLRKVSGADKYYADIPEFEQPEQLLGFDVTGTGTISLKHSGELIYGNEQGQGPMYNLTQYAYFPGIRVFDLEITNEGSSKTYEIVLNIGDVSQRELVELWEQQSQNPSQISWNGQYLETTVSSSSASLYLGTDPRYARVVVGGNEIPAEDGAYPLSLNQGENIVQIWIQNPITLEEETIIFKITSMTGQI